MKHLLATVFALALLLVPALGLARTTYQAPYLACTAAYPVVSVGNAGRFNVVTNANGPFTWVADNEEYSVRDIGSQFVTPFTHVGRQQVTVVWGTTRASCFVSVVPAPGYGEPYTGPAFGGQHTTYGGYGPNVSLSSVAYPFLPNAGFGPQTLAAFAFATVLLLGAAIALYPYAKKAFVIVTR